jgi:hypothetical protein
MIRHSVARESTFAAVVLAALEQNAQRWARKDRPCAITPTARTSPTTSLECARHHRAIARRIASELRTETMTKPWIEVEKSAAAATTPVCTENPIRVDDVTESPKLAE